MDNSKEEMAALVESIVDSTQPVKAEVVIESESTDQDKMHMLVEAITAGPNLDLMRANMFVNQKLREANAQSLPDREKFSSGWTEAMRSVQVAITELKKVINGGYGDDAKNAANIILSDRRRNRVAALGQLVALIVYKCPQDSAIDAWKKLSPEERQKINSAFEGVINTPVSMESVSTKEKDTDSETNPWAVCTASVGREDKAKFERCVKDVKKQEGVKTESVQAQPAQQDAIAALCS